LISVPVVLFTCAGQRVDIVSAFAAAGATTLAVDCNELAPALYVADRHVLTPRVDEPGYIDSLRELVAEHEVSLIVPVADLDHRALAEARESMGALVLLPGADAIALCEDKYAAHRFFEREAIPSPPTWEVSELPATLPFPVLVKARRGYGSRHIYRAATARELEFFIAYTTQESIVQSACLGTEYSIDVLCDLESRCLNAIPRTMIESKGGESIKGMTIDDRELVEHGCAVAEAMKLIGPATIQCFREADGSLPVTDVNPRFGGAFPLPTAAGSEYPELSLALAAGERPEPRLGSYRVGVVMTRYFSQLGLERVGDGLEPVIEAAAGEL